jgi:molybdate transport system substrate-binding protein
MQMNRARKIVRVTFASFMLFFLAASDTWAQGEAKKPSVTHEVSVAAAADLKFALDEIITAFSHEQTETTVKVTYGSSGNFFAQLSNRAPFDMFFSADMSYPQKLVEQGLAQKETLFLYAVGRIVVWVPNASPLNVENMGIQAVVDPAVRKIAIANPQHAPYGRAAEAAMKKLGVYEQAQSRLVLGENIAQTAQFIETGAADIGIIALSLAIAPAMRDKGRYWEVPLEEYPRMDQGGVILSWAKDLESANRFRAFVTGTSGRAVLKRYGFSLPGE